MMSAVSKDQKLHYSLHLCDLIRLSFMISNYSKCFFFILAVLLWENVAMEVLNKTNWGWAGPSSAQAGIELWLRYTTLNGLTRLNGQYNIAQSNLEESGRLYYCKTWSNEVWYTIEFLNSPE